MTIWLACPFIAFTAMVLGCSAIPAMAQTGCQSVSAGIQRPYASGFTIPSTFDVSVNGYSGGPCWVTRIRLYVDNQPYALSREYPPAPNAVQDAEFNVTLPQGYHNLVAVTYNNAGYAAASSVNQVFVAPKDKTIYITAPASNATVGSPTVIGARGRWDGPTYYYSQIQHMRVYVDNVDVYDTNLPQLMFQKSFAPGLHHLVVIAWNKSGAFIQASEYFTSK
jgi:hypothetical protein